MAVTITDTIAAALATVKGETLATRKARLDAAFHAGTKADRTELMAYNGVRAARESRGYGRAACAKALGITAAEYWQGEFVLPKGSTEAKALIALIGRLPDLKAAKKAADKKAVDSKKSAPKAAPKAAPAEAKKADAADLL